MNNDLISREALRKAFHERIYYFNKSSWDEANAIIDNAPTVAKSCKKLQEVANERPQGEWIDTGKFPIRWKCSNCGRRDQYIYNYCPNCGSYNRGE